jgi:hypothetical protein
MMHGTEALKRFVQITTDQFMSTCTDKGYRVLAANADRHGSLIWEAGRARDLNRFILLGVTEVPSTTIPVGLVERIQKTAGDIEATYEAELWIAADDNTRFTRVLFDHWFMFLSAQRPLMPTAELLSQWFATAIDKVESLSRADLTEEYVVPRGEGLHSAVSSA